MKLGRLCSLAMMLGLAASAGASEVAVPFKLSTADIDRMVATSRNGAAMGTVPTGAKGPRVVVLRRTQSGEPEVHDLYNDVFVVRSGRATVMIGGTVAGNRQVSSGEWRGGTITGAAPFEVAPGDVLWIPAGLPHQVILPRGADFSYLTFKSPK